MAPKANVAAGAFLLVRARAMDGRDCRDLIAHAVSFFLQFLAKTDLHTYLCTATICMHLHKRTRENHLSFAKPIRNTKAVE
jgi:hypothetical protein